MEIGFFATDLHGRIDLYDKLLAAVARERPRALFLGGDLLPPMASASNLSDTGEGDFVRDVLVPRCLVLREALGAAYPRVFVIPGNDDPRCEEAAIVEAASSGIWDYAHNRRLPLGRRVVIGYAYVPPTPFLFKDWERYDVSRFVDPGCVSPEEGWRSVPQPPHEIRYGTMRKDLEALTAEAAQAGEIFLFHAPPYGTPLDRADLDTRMIDHVPVDTHVGSVAIRDLITARQPLLTLHGHVHEAARLTGVWMTKIGRTVCINGAHDGPELSLVRVDLDAPETATRELL